jgi:hypothetical protein
MNIPSHHLTLVEGVDSQTVAEFKSHAFPFSKHAGKNQLT